MILINGYFLEHPYSGTGLVTKELLDAFYQNPKVAQESQVLCFAPPSKEVQELLETWNVSYMVLPLPSVIPSFLRRFYWESVAIPLFLRKISSYRYFSTYAHPMLIPCGFMQCFMMVHDVFPWKYSAYARKLLRKIHNGLLKCFLKYTSVNVITVSETSRADIAAYFQRDSVVIYNGTDHLQKEPLYESSYLEQQWGIRGPYIFYMGGYDERKNIPVLMQTLGLLVEKFPQYTIVLGGGALYNSSLYTNPEAIAQDASHIIHTGFLTMAQMRTLFHYATCFVHASLDEGCNIAVGEALMEGTAACISNIPVHKELWGTEAYLIDFTDAQKASTMMQEIVPTLQRRSAPHTLYSWHDAAANLLQLLA